MNYVNNTSSLILLLPVLIVVASVYVATSDNNNSSKDAPLHTKRRRRHLYEWQSATPYNDPDNLCGGYPGVTGYRATLGCTGYVYCNNGFLMGGGAGYEAVNSAIKCHDGQLFDEGLGACSSTMKSCPTGGGSSGSGSSSSSPSTRRPTDKPIQQYYPNPPTHQPVEPVGSDNNDPPPPPLPVPNTGAPSSAQPPDGQAAAAIIVESATSNTVDVDNEGEDWSQAVVVSTTIITNSPTSSSKPASIMDWIPAPSEPAYTTNIEEETTTNNNNKNNNRCTSNNDCLFYNNSPYNICNQPNPLEAGYCGQCLTFNGMGCSTSQICQSTSIIQTSTQFESVSGGSGTSSGGGGGGKCRSYNGFGITHEVGITKCFNKSTLDYDCQVILNDVEAVCNLNLMMCEGTAHEVESSVVYDQQQQQQQQQTVDGSSSSSSNSSVAAAAVILPPPSTSNPTPQPISSPVVVPIPTEVILDKEESSVTSSSAQPTLSFLSAIMASSTTSSQQQAAASSQQQTEQIEASQTSSSSSQQIEQQPSAVVIPETAPREEPTTMIVCNLCGTDTTTTVLNPSQVVSLDGNAYMKCEELTQIFTSMSIIEGSTRCLNFRGQFYNPCCIENVNEEKEVAGGASSVVSQGLAVEEEDDTSSFKCSLCGDPNFNTINSGGIVLFLGEEITCNELGNMMYTEIRFDSSDCMVAQRSYSGTCCTTSDGTFNNNNNINNSPVGIPPTPSPHSSTSSTTAIPPYLSNWNTNVMSTASRTCLASFTLSFCLPIASVFMYVKSQ